MLYVLGIDVTTGMEIELTQFEFALNIKRTCMLHLILKCVCVFECVCAMCVCCVCVCVQGFIQDFFWLGGGRVGGPDQYNNIIIMSRVQLACISYIVH